MSVSREEYKRILASQEAGHLKIMIDTSGFRKLLVDRVDPSKLSAALGQPVHAHVRLIRALTYLDATAPVAVCLLSVLAFGLWGVVGAGCSLVAWAAYKARASRGAQHLLPVTIALVLHVVAAVILPLPNWWARGFVALLGVMFFIERSLYTTTAYVVFSLVHSNYEFFKMFYLQPTGAIVPLIWTTELDMAAQAQVRANGG